MILHREYLCYGSQWFTITIEGDGPRRASQPLIIRAESASRGKRRDPTKRQVTTTVDGAKGYIKSVLDSEFPTVQGAWKQFSFQLDDGKYTGGSIALSQAVRDLIRECGLELARDQLESDKEREIVALCGGLDNALKVLDYCEVHQ